MKGLFDFPLGDIGYREEPTPVVAEAIKTPASPPVTVCAVYLASEVGFSHYCEVCPLLAMVQETGLQTFSLRVFCSAVKCNK